MIGNIFTPAKIYQSVAPVHPIPSASRSVSEPLDRRSFERARLSEDVAFVDGAMRPISRMEAMVESSALVSG
jgi:hypothetical protein